MRQRLRKGARAGEELLDRALHYLEREGIELGDPEVVDLLRDSGAAALPQAGARTRLRARLARRVLQETPAAFSLHDRAGAKAFTLAGGEATFGAPARWAFADAASARAPGGPGAAAADMAGLAAARMEAAGSPDAAAGMAGLVAADTAGLAAAGERLLAPLAEALRLRIALRREDRPLFIRNARPETVDALRSLLVVLRGSEAEAEAKPLAILQATAEPGQAWGREACRLITLGARRGLPLAIAPAEPPAGPLPRDWSLRAAAAAVAATLIHQLARRRAPLAWALPLRPWFEGSEAHRRAWRSLFAVADWLELPTIALLGVPPDSTSAETAAAAAMAISAHARLLVCAGGGGGGEEESGPARRSVPEIFRLPSRQALPRDGGRERERPTARLPEEIEAALDQLVRNEAARCGVEAPDLSSEAGDA